MWEEKRMLILSTSSCLSGRCFSWASRESLRSLEGEMGVSSTVCGCWAFSSAIVVFAFEGDSLAVVLAVVLAVENRLVRFVKL